MRRTMRARLPVARRWSDNRSPRPARSTGRAFRRSPQARYGTRRYRLLDILGGIPGEVRSRVTSPFFYAGLATRYESERLTEDERDNLPERINELRPARFNNWLSEREWIPVMMETASQPRRLLLRLDVDETNIDYLENASCEEIFNTRLREYQDSYRRIPALDELRARYGDPTNRKIYMMSRDIEGRWLDMRQRATGIKTPIN